MILQTVRTRAAPVVERANVWLAERSARERVLLAGLAVLGLVAVGWYGLAQPLLNARENAVARIELYETLQARLRAAPVGAAVSPGGPPISGPLDQAARQAAATNALNAEVTGDAQRIAVRLTNARFDAAVLFVRALEGGGAVVDDLRMENAGQPGLINVSLTAARP